MSEKYQKKAIQTVFRRFAQRILNHYNKGNPSRASRKIVTFHHPSPHTHLPPTCPKMSENCILRVNMDLNGKFTIRRRFTCSASIQKKLKTYFHYHQCDQAEQRIRRNYSPILLNNANFHPFLHYSAQKILVFQLQESRFAKNLVSQSKILHFLPCSVSKFANNVRF